MASERTLETTTASAARIHRRVAGLLLASLGLAAALWWSLGGPPDVGPTPNAPLGRTGASIDVEVDRPLPVARASGWCVPWMSGTVVAGSGVPAIAAVDLGVDELRSVGAADTPTRWRRTDLPSVPGWPVVDDGLLVVGLANGVLQAFDMSTGAQRWVSSSGGRQRPAVVQGLVVAHDGLSASAVSRKSGQLVWDEPADPLRRVVGTVGHHGRRIHVARTREQRDRFTSAAYDVVDVLDVGSGRRVARLEMTDPSELGRPVLQDLTMVGEDLVTLERAGLVVGRDPRDGTPRWLVETDPRASAVGAVDEAPAVLVGLDWFRIVVAPDRSAQLSGLPERSAVGAPCQFPTTWFGP